MKRLRIPITKLIIYLTVIIGVVISATHEANDFTWWQYLLCFAPTWTLLVKVIDQAYDTKKTEVMVSHIERILQWSMDERNKAKTVGKDE